MLCGSSLLLFENLCRPALLFVLSAPPRITSGDSYLSGESRAAFRPLGVSCGVSLSIIAFTMSSLASIEGCWEACPAALCVESDIPRALLGVRLFSLPSGLLSHRAQVIFVTCPCSSFLHPLPGQGPMLTKRLLMGRIERGARRGDGEKAPPPLPGLWVVRPLLEAGVRGALVDSAKGAKEECARAFAVEVLSPKAAGFP